jgi:hypothetical protein
MAQFDDSSSLVKSFVVSGTAAIPPFSFVKMDGPGRVALAVAPTDNVIGIARVAAGREVTRYGQTPPAIEAKVGDAVDVVLLGNGIWMVQLGAALTEGSMVTAGPGGKAVALIAAPVAGTTFLRLMSGGALNSTQAVLMNAFYKSA